MHFGAVKPGRYQFEVSKGDRLALVSLTARRYCQVRHHRRTGIGEVS